MTDQANDGSGQWLVLVAAFFAQIGLAGRYICAPGHDSIHLQRIV